MNISHLRSPVCCVVGHVDSGKTLFQDKLRHSKVQAHEVGGITQQIGATYFTKNVLESMAEGMKGKLGVPGILFIDTPGHDCFSNLRTTGIEICDLAIVIVDIIKGIEFQTLECLKILKQHRKPFIIIANKLDLVYEWISPQEEESKNLKTNMKRQSKLVLEQLTKYLNQIICQTAEQEINSAPYYLNNDDKEFVSIVPVSSVTGEGIPNVILLISSIANKFMMKKLTFKEDTTRGYIMEVRKVPHIGDVANVILVNGIMRRGDKFLALGYDGIIDSEVKEMMLPNDGREMKDNSGFNNLCTELIASHGFMLKATHIGEIIPSSKLICYYSEEERIKAHEFLSKELLELGDKLKSHVYAQVGVYIHGRSVGAIESVKNLCDHEKIPVVGVFIGSLTKKNIIHAGAIVNGKEIMKDKDLFWYHRRHSVILSYGIENSKEMKDFCKKNFVTLIEDDIIYRLSDKYLKLRKENDEELHIRHKGFSPYTKGLIFKEHIYRTSNPYIFGVRIESGRLKKNTTVMAVCYDDSKIVQQILLGELESIEKDKKTVDELKLNQEGCLKIKNKNGEFSEELHNIKNNTSNKIWYIETYYTPEQQYLMKAFPEVFDPHSLVI
jgi:translation initiation factor 5B